MRLDSYFISSYTAEHGQDEISDYLDAFPLGPSVNLFFGRISTANTRCEGRTVSQLETSWTK